MKGVPARLYGLSPTPTQASESTRAKPLEPPGERDRLPMVSWFNPVQLARTGVDVAISTIFGRHSDYRLIEALSSPDDEPVYYDHSVLTTDAGDGASGQAVDDLVIDYVADTGDGWDSTYAVAYWMSRPTLEARDSTGHESATRRGDVLVFGGDQVYPSAGRLAYKRRLVAPYRAARPHCEAPVPYLYALPGNHDWYDSLASFTRLFCNRRTFACWQTQQARSYFAVKLPHHWWLLGADLQLHSDIDRPQKEYFQRVRAEMRDGDNVILCVAEPHWSKEAAYRDLDPEETEDNIRFLQQGVLAGVNVRLFLAGDKHHYRRHAHPVDGTQRITAGGGGAFLHPTHAPDVSRLADGSELARSYPDEATSRRLTWGNLKFPFLNPSFGIVTALLYLFIAWSTRTQTLGRAGIDQPLRAARYAVRGILTEPWWLVAVLIGFVFFTDTHSRLYRWLGGLSHGACHVVAAFLLAWLAARLNVHLDLSQDSIRGRLLSGFVLLAGGWGIGSLLMGLYLLVSVNVFGRHSNESFSSLRVPDYKHFLRLHIDRSGNLPIFPFGLTRVPRRWRRSTGDEPTASLLEPSGGDWTEPALIEDPIRLPARPTAP